MKLFRKVVDERQELEMMHIERGAFYVMVFALAIGILIQIFALDFDFTHVAGEFIVLLIGTVWAFIGSIRRGSWDYFTKPGMKAYLIYSIATGLIFGLVAPLTRYFRYGAPLMDCLRVFAKNFIILFMIAFLTLLLFGTIAKKRQEKLQQKHGDSK